MQIIRAESMGLCFGVRDALALSAAVEEPEDTTIWGELVHNEVVLDELEARGFRMVSESGRDTPPATHSVLLTAHGVSDHERRRLANAGKTLIDTTCPLVHRVHEAAQRLAVDGRLVIVIGRREHVEVRGIVGDLTDYEIVESADDVRQYATERLGLVSQSTTSPQLVAEISRTVVERNPGADIEQVDTVCQPTKDRQQALERLLRRVDIVVVVGGKNSNNTKKLADSCRERGVPAHHVQSAADLDPSWFDHHERVGLTAGTSTLDAAIDAVHARLLSIAGERGTTNRSA